MAKSFKPLTGGRTHTRVLVNGHYVTLRRAREAARQIVARDAKDALAARQERLWQLLG